MQRATTLGTRMRQLREEKGISQRELAKRAGITSAYVSRLEHDLNPNISAKVIYGLARGLGTTVDDLLIAAGYYDQSTEELPDLATYLRRTTVLEARSIQMITKLVEFMVAESKQ